MLTFTNLSFEPATGVVQFQDGNINRPKVSLRICTADGVPLFVLGTATKPVFYDAEAIVRGLAEGGNEFETPLPDPVPYPEVLSRLSADDACLILDAALGVPRVSLVARFGSPEGFTNLLTRVHTMGFAISNPTSVGPIEVKVRAAMAQKQREVASTQHLLAAIDKSGASTSSVDPVRGFFVIDRAPQALLRQISTRTEPTYDTRPRMTWNFDKMLHGDRMLLPANLAKRGQTAVHVYAARCGKRFHTSTDRGTGDLTVIRIADRTTRQALD